MSIIKTLIVNGKRVLMISRTKPQDRSIGTPLRSTSRKIMLLGTNYNIKLNEGKRNAVKIENGTLHVTLNPMTRENMTAYLDGWHRRYARNTILRSVEQWLPQFEAHGYTVPEPRIKLFAMRRAWGRCYYTKGLITINLHLLKTPTECIDYIVLHELCHFVIHNHSASFHALMSEMMPHWRTIDLQLKEFARSRMVITNKR